MESPYYEMTHNFEEENRLFQSGYIKGYHDAMIKGTQEAIKPKSKVRHGASAQIQHFCGNCNSMLHGKPKFCSECGRSVKWE